MQFSQYRRHLSTWVVMFRICLHIYLTRRIICTNLAIKAATMLNAESALQIAQVGTCKQGAPTKLHFLRCPNDHGLFQML